MILTDVIQAFVYRGQKSSYALVITSHNLQTSYLSALESPLYASGLKDTVRMSVKQCPASRNQQHQRLHYVSCHGMTIALTILMAVEPE